MEALLLFVLLKTKKFIHYWSNYSVFYYFFYISIFLGSVTKKYWLKANETNWGLNPDARELVAYLLLKVVALVIRSIYIFLF